MKEIIENQIKLLIDNENLKTVSLPIYPLFYIVMGFLAFGFERGPIKNDNPNVYYEQHKYFSCDFTHEKIGIYRLTGSMWFGDYKITKV